MTYFVRIALFYNIMLKSYLKLLTECYFETWVSNLLGTEVRNYIHSNNFEINLKVQDGEYSGCSDLENVGSKSDRIMLEYDYWQLSEEGPEQ